MSNLMYSFTDRLLNAVQDFEKLMGRELVNSLEEMSLIRFSTISVRLVYIKMINYRGSILANLNKTMQPNEHATKKPQSYRNRNKIY